MHGPSLPFQGRWLGAAETERSLQICDNLSVSLRLPAPLKGEPWMVHSASEFSRVPMFQASFHTIVTSRAYWYAPPDMLESVL